MKLLGSRRVLFSRGGGGGRDWAEEECGYFQGLLEVKTPTVRVSGPALSHQSSGMFQTSEEFV